MEEFRVIKGYEGLYEISNFGAVKSFKYNKIDGCILKSSINSSGYYCVNLYKDNIRKTLKLHRLMGQAFIENPNEFEYIDHINQNKLDNRLENLRWINNSGNIRNVTKRNNNKSGYRGVSWVKNRKRWRARINIDGKSIYLGYYENPEDASKVYEEKYNEVMKQFEK